MSRPVPCVATETDHDLLDGYARFCALTDQYAQLAVAQSRARLEQDVKKKIQPYSRHSRKKSKGSLNPS